MKKTDLAYTAGIIDGEGSIGIAKQKRTTCKRGYSFILYVQVTSSDEWLCQSLKFAFTGSISHSINNAGNPMWHWVVGNKQALSFLRLIVPYLKLKRPQAELAIKFQEAKRYQPNKTDEQLAVEAAQRLMLQNMHKRPSGSHKGLRQELPA